MRQLQAKIVHRKFREARLSMLSFEPDMKFPLTTTWLGLHAVNIRPALFIWKADRYITVAQHVIAGGAQWLFNGHRGRGAAYSLAL
jgi:hypothetical protein